MQLWHQSRFVIDQYVTITASFDEQSSIDCPSIHSCIEISFSSLACQSGSEMSTSLSYHSHFDVVGLQRHQPDSRYIIKYEIRAQPIRENDCGLYYLTTYHSHFWRVGVCATSAHIERKSIMEIDRNGAWILLALTK